MAETFIRNAHPYLMRVAHMAGVVNDKVANLTWQLEVPAQVQEVMHKAAAFQLDLARTGYDFKLFWPGAGSLFDNTSMSPLYAHSPRELQEPHEVAYTLFPGVAILPPHSSEFVMIRCADVMSRRKLQAHSSAMDVAVSTSDVHDTPTSLSSRTMKADLDSIDADMDSSRPSLTTTAGPDVAQDKTRVADRSLPVKLKMPKHKLPKAKLTKLKLKPFKAPKSTQPTVRHSAEDWRSLPNYCPPHTITRRRRFQQA